MYEELQRKVTEEKPSYSREEIKWLLEHLGNPSPEIRDELVFTSLARGIQEELFSLEQFRFISEEVSSDEGLYKEIDSRGVSALKRSFRALIYANHCLAMVLRNHFITSSCLLLSGLPC